MIVEAKLNTLHMFENEDKKNPDYQFWKRIAEYINGETAILIKLSFNENYIFLSLKDKVKDKELFYMMEQDAATGRFLDNRKGFDEEWDSGEYSRDETFCIEPKYLIFESKEDNHAERID